MSNTQDRAREAAVNELLESLFTNGSGQKATRLVLWDDKRDFPANNLGGWGKAVIKDKLQELWMAREAEVGLLKTALQNLVDAVEQAGKDLVGIYQMAAIHGVTYTGRQYIHELAEAKAALSGGEEK